MCEYKLTYFDIKCRAEPIRLAFAVAQVPFEDIRLPYTPVLPPEQKSLYPFGQLPVLEFEGTCLSQSMTIGRFLARRFNLCGENEWESAKVDEICDAFADYGACFGEIHDAEGEEEKEKARQNVIQVSTPKYMGKIDEMLKKSESGYLIGKSLTFADIVAANFVTYVGPLMSMDLTKDFPNLQAHVKLIESIPQIKDWIEKRPKTVF